jgi:hypothetical protein
MYGAQVVEQGDAVMEMPQQQPGLAAQTIENHPSWTLHVVATCHDMCGSSTLANTLAYPLPPHARYTIPRV